MTEPSGGVSQELPQAGFAEPGELGHGHCVDHGRDVHPVVGFLCGIPCVVAIMYAILAR